MPWLTLLLGFAAGFSIGLLIGTPFGFFIAVLLSQASERVNENHARQSQDYRMN